MKKRFLKIFAAALCLAMAFLAVACTDSDSDATAGDTDNKPVESSFSIKYNGAQIKLGDKWSNIEGKLGSPVSSLPTGNCGGLGETFRYDYSALAVTVVQYTDGDTLVDKVTLKNDAATTDKGIYIGSQKSDVTDAYGTPTEENETSLKYVSGSAELVFGISDGKVSSIMLSKNG